jgi:tRNA dimethylallyltransferase
MKASSRRVLAIVGPTASGKTAISLALAEQLRGEVVSADSRQIYRFMDIGTAKPTMAERRRVKHYFIDQLFPDEDFNAGEFGRRGREVVEQIFGRKKLPIVVGGSGLYVRSLIDGLFEGPSRDDSVRKALYDRLHREGSETLLNELARIDPAAAAKLIPSNTRRIIRALEVYFVTGVSITRLQEERGIAAPFETVLVGLDWERKKLYARIEERVDRMIEQGLVEEVRSLIRKGYGPSLNSLQTVGYQEVFECLDGKTNSARMVELIKQNSRRFAKRQLTWFRRDARVKWFRVEDELEFPRTSRAIGKYFNELAS